MNFGAVARRQSTGLGFQGPVKEENISAPELLARINSYSKLFFTALIACGGSIVIGIILSIIFSAVKEEAGIVVFGVFLFAGSGLGIWTAVEFFLLIFNYWKIIPPTEAETTPGKAVGFLFIPFFNLYWGFVAYYGLGKAMQRMTGNSDAATWGLMLAIGTCTAGVPFVGGIFHLVSLIGTVNAFQRQAKTLLQG